jgi:hypothetical protein
MIEALLVAVMTANFEFQAQQRFEESLIFRELVAQIFDRPSCEESKQRFDRYGDYICVNGRWEIIPSYQNWE